MTVQASMDWYEDENMQQLKQQKDRLEAALPYNSTQTMARMRNALNDQAAKTAPAHSASRDLDVGDDPQASLADGLPQSHVRGPTNADEAQGPKLNTKTPARRKQRRSRGRGGRRRAVQADEGQTPVDNARKEMGKEAPMPSLPPPPGVDPDKWANMSDAARRRCRKKHKRLDREAELCASQLQS